MARRPIMPVAAEGQDDLAAAISEFVDDPLGFVLFCYPWGQEGTPLEHEEGPDVWQTKFLLRLGRAIEEGREKDAAGLMSSAIQMATVSGHGVGKTALVAWLIHWFISTRPNPQIICTANTVSQLTGKTWRELAKWRRLAINGDWFQWTATKYYLKGQSDTWFAAAVPWSKDRAEAFAGTHETHVLLLFDEASAIADEIWEVAEGALTTSGAMWLVFGNGTKNTGRFRECFRRFRHRWTQFHVDAREAKRANAGKIAEWIADYGEDSDFVRVRVKGEFPRAATSQFIGQDVIDAAAERYRRRATMIADGMKIPYLPRQSNSGEIIVPADEMDWGDNPSAPMILSLDVARFGDDTSVLGGMCGTMFRILGRWQSMDGPQLAHEVAPFIDALKPDAIMVDVVGVGASPADQLKLMGYEIIEVNGGLAALDDQKFFNRRTEMYDKARSWMKAGGMIPPDETLMADLGAIEYGFDGKTRLQLERKEDMKERLGRSPDDADCLSMCFFQHVAPKMPRGTLAQRLAELASAGEGSWKSR